MKLIKSKIIPMIQEDYTLKGIKKQIEIAGRTCYKSEDKITDDSCEEFVQRMINSGHMSILEHGTVYLTIPIEEDKEGFIYKNIINPYSQVYMNGKNAYITTNYRVIVENEWGNYLQYLTAPTDDHRFRYTFKFICDRGVSHELVRHRCMSFAQESTRYCNYTKDKFNNEITYIIPVQMEDKLPEGNYTYWDGDWCDLDKMCIQHACDNSTEDLFLTSLQCSEDYYDTFIGKGMKPQEARQVLPNALKTEVVVTGFSSNWFDFIELRTASNAHPDIQKLAHKVNNLIWNYQQRIHQ